jgi:hypothetical protein
MFEQFIAGLPSEWQPLVEALLLPLAWIPEMQSRILAFFMEPSSAWIATLKYVLLFPPLLLWIGAIWCTHLSLYTLPFRSGRQKFFSMLLVSWWDAARSVWQYWVGMFRLCAVVIGWLFALARLILNFFLEVLRQLLVAPFAMTGRLSKSYFQPGVPWIAFALLLFWSLLEATIFTYTLFPTVSEVLADLAGFQAPQYTGPILFMFLLFLILGSFACLQALLETIKKRDFKFLVQMVIVELFVMFFEVMFLYRELVDAITPWIAQHTGEQFRMGVFFTLSLATFGWVGIRGMTWFLFGQFGTPPLLAFISRRPLQELDERQTPEAVEPAPAWWRPVIEDFKREIDWLHGRAEELAGYLSLPVLQVVGAVMNFASVLVTSKPVFSLPFRSIKEVMETRQVMAAMDLEPRKVGA